MPVTPVTGTAASEEANATINTERLSWRATDSALFADLGRVFTPRRDEIAAAVCELVPGDSRERG